MDVDDWNGTAGVESNDPACLPRHALLFNLVLHPGSRPFDSSVMLDHYVSKLRCVFSVVFISNSSQLF